VGEWTTEREVPAAGEPGFVDVVFDFDRRIAGFDGIIVEAKSGSQQYSRDAVAQLRTYRRPAAPGRLPLPGVGNCERMNASDGPFGNQTASPSKTR
jgi:hypothetical protein